VNLFGGAWSPDPERQPSSRAQRLLVRALLALRSEARSRPYSQSDRARAEALADRIMLELPRSVLPIGLAALFIVGVVCLMPLMRDAVAEGTEQRAVPVASVMEHGIRSQGAALSDGFEAMREVVAPFAAGDAPSSDADASSDRTPPADATAFSRS
jgi:hypothetical protein